MTSKTHYRKAFNSPYLSSADVVGPTILTISRVELAPDQTKKTKDFFNTAFFKENELRPGEKLKPMILNAHNSRVMRDLTGSHFLEDWANVAVTVYVQEGIKFGRDTVEGLRISPQPPQMQRPTLSQGGNTWSNAKAAYKRDGNLDKVKERLDVPEELELKLIEEVKAEQQ
jgi:hypothetical protein